MFNKNALATFLVGLSLMPCMASAAVITDSFTAPVASEGFYVPTSIDSNLKLSVSGTSAGAPGGENVIFGGVDFSSNSNGVTYASNGSQSFYASNSYFGSNYEFLTFTFTHAVSQLSFSFDDFASDNGATASVYGIAGNLLKTIAVDQGQGLTTYAFTGITGIHSLVFDNNVNGTNGFDSVFGVGSIVYTPSSTPITTPLPPALFFVAPALAGVFGFKRRKSGNGQS